jgi:hypothetical protein
MKKYAAILSFPLLVVAGASACKKEAPPPPPPAPVTAPPTTVPPPVAVSAVTLGSAIGEDKKVADSKDTFGKKDTIYASVDSAGTGHAKLRALWTFVKGDKSTKVDETTIEFDSSAPAVNEFHVSKPSGWPVGDYKIEVFLNDAAEASMTKEFKVK